MFASKCRLAFEQTFSSADHERNGALISAEAQSGTGGALLNSNASVGGAASSEGLGLPADHEPLSAEQA